jgi:uncharacterized protein (DUF58 family)
MHLGERAYALLVLTAVALLAAVWSADPLIAAVWPWLACALLAGLAWEGFALRRLRLSGAVRNAARLLLGRQSAALLEVSANARSALQLEISPVAPAGIEGPATTRHLEILPGSSAHSTLALRPVALGRQTWVDFQARVRGSFGLAWWDARIPIQQTTLVAPDALRGARPRRRGVASGMRPRRVVGAGSELYQLREYLAGDPPARIDWKASARAAALMTREFSEDQHLDVVVAIDAGRLSHIRTGALDRLSLYGNLAARFAEGAVVNDDQIGLVIYADRVVSALPPARGLAAVIRIRRELEQLAVSPAESEPLAAAARIRALLRHRGLVVLLTDLDDASVADQLARVVRVLTPPHQIVIAGVENREIEQLATRTARGWRDPYVALAAREHQASAAAQRAVLQRMGVPVIAAREERLEAAVFEEYERLRLARRI